MKSEKRANVGRWKLDPREIIIEMMTAQVKLNFLSHVYTGTECCVYKQVAHINNLYALCDENLFL